MFANYAKTALRNMRRQWLYSLLNIFGLTIGITSALLVARYALYELSYDTFLPNAQRIYRIVKREPGNTYLGSNTFAVTPAPTAKLLETDIPGITAATTFNSLSRTVVSLYKCRLQKALNLNSGKTQGFLKSSFI